MLATMWNNWSSQTLLLVVQNYIEPLQKVVKQSVFHKAKDMLILCLRNPTLGVHSLEIEMYSHTKTCV